MNQLRSASLPSRKLYLQENIYKALLALLDSNSWPINYNASNPIQSVLIKSFIGTSFLNISSNTTLNSDSWILDSGVMHHVYHCERLFNSLHKLHMLSKVNLPNDSTITIDFVGSVLFFLD